MPPLAVPSSDSACESESGSGRGSPALVRQSGPGEPQPETRSQRTPVPLAPGGGLRPEWALFCCGLTDFFDGRLRPSPETVTVTVTGARTLRPGGTLIKLTWTIP